MMTLITGFTCPPTIYFKFITKCDKCYYKVRQVLQSVTILLQSATVQGVRPFYFWKLTVLVPRYNYSFVRNKVLIKYVFWTQTAYFFAYGFFNVSVYSLFQTLHNSKQLIFPVFRWVLRDLS